MSQRLAKWFVIKGGRAAVAGNLRVEVRPAEIRMFRNGEILEICEIHKRVNGAWITADISSKRGEDIARRWIKKMQALGTKATSTPAAPATPPAWRPIETAPRDGTEILAVCLPLGIRHLFWNDAWFLVGAPLDHYRPTHWLPLSALPAVPR